MWRVNKRDPLSWQWPMVVQTLNCLVHFCSVLQLSRVVTAVHIKKISLPLSALEKVKNPAVWIPIYAYTYIYDPSRLYFHDFFAGNFQNVTDNHKIVHDPLADLERSLFFFFLEKISFLEDFLGDELINPSFLANHNKNGCVVFKYEWPLETLRLVSFCPRDLRKSRLCFSPSLG